MNGSTTSMSEDREAVAQARLSVVLPTFPLSARSTVVATILVGVQY